MAMRFIWIKIFYDFHNVIFSKRDRRKKFTCSFNPIQDELFWACSRMGGGAKSPLPKICHTHPAMMKLCTVMRYLRTIQKIYKPRDTPLTFC